MYPTGHQNDIQHHQPHRHSSYRVSESAPYPPASQRSHRHTYSSPSSSSMSSSRGYRESSFDHSDTRGSDASPPPEERQSSQGDPELPGLELDLVGQPINYRKGPFAGSTVRMALTEIQKADLGRKYARVDRRPLDPPPVALLRMYHVHNEGTSQEFEVEVDYEEIDTSGFLCTVDLFPVPALGLENSSSSSSNAPTLSYYPSDNRPTSRRTPPSVAPSQSSFHLAESSLRGHQDGRHLPQGGLATQFQISGTSQPGPLNHPSTSSSGSPAYHEGLIAPTPSSPEVVYVHNGFPIAEQSNQTLSLVGQTFISPTVVDYMGSKALVFAFSDLAVKMEGTFILRYRVFDLKSFPAGHSDDRCITTEAYGGMFRVYSTKDFPGLSKSTALTKHLARYGLRLNIRETERKRRRKSGNEDRSDDTYSDSY